MQKLKEILGLKAKSRKYEGMRDSKTKLPNGGGKLTEYTMSVVGARKVTKFMTGTFKAGKENGHYGIEIAKDLRYEGEMVDGKINGIGKLSNKIGGSHETYIGEWKAGVRHGFGKYIDKVNKALYVGEFKDGLWHGHGRMDQTNEYTYEGDF